MWALGGGAGGAGRAGGFPQKWLDLLPGGNRAACGLELVGYGLSSGARGLWEGGAGLSAAWHGK
jgi:hypothetical protein